MKDGRLEIDNNRSERAMKPFVIGRKNWLFANTARGAKASATIYSIMETAKENDLNPFQDLHLSGSTIPLQAIASTYGSKRPRSARQATSVVTDTAARLPGHKTTIATGKTALIMATWWGLFDAYGATLLPKVARGHVFIFFEHPDEINVAGVAYASGNLLKRELRVMEQLLRCFNPDFVNVFG